jgi:UDP-N-acetylmuramyl pentapeptide phosphotransferase/UDP-N-acetylglucosamine-1-phosphate transferase
LPYIKKWIEQKKILKEDINKFKRPRLKSLEGLICIILFIVTISFVLGLQTLLRIENLDLSFFIPGLLSIIIIALVGFIDDILDLNPKKLKIILILPALIPIASVTLYATTINIPFLKSYNASIFYPLLIIPAIIVISALIVNSPESFNKLNLNVYFIISAALFVCTVLAKNSTATILFSCLLGLILVLRNYNMVHQKISLGRMGRFSFGAIFAIGAIIGNVKLALVILLIPYLVYLIIQKTYKFLLRDRGFSWGMISFFGKTLTRERLANYITALEIICALIAIVIQIQRVEFF